MTLVCVCLSKPWFLESVFHIIVSFSVNLCISGLQSSFGEISENYFYNEIHVFKLFSVWDLYGSDP